VKAETVYTARRWQTLRTIQKGMIDRIKNNKITIGLILLLFVFLTNFQFLPTFGGLGSVKFSNLLYNALTMASIIFVLIGLLAFLVFLWILITEKRISKRVIVIIALGLFGYVNGTIIPKYMSGYAKKIVIQNASGLIDSIEKYYVQNTDYPDSLNQLIPKYIDKIPKPGVNGIAAYDYKKLQYNYEIRFYQNDIMSFNYDVVIYNPKGEHQGQGEQPKLIETGIKNWKYYWYD
jgi:hypothetical protein